ncbi:MAG: DUF6290 family protein [Promethearchaeota archaeon]
MKDGKNNSKRIFIQIHLSKKEKEKISEYAKKEHITMSGFCKKAIFDYIRRIENPEKFDGLKVTQFNPLMIEQISNNMKKLLELQDLTLERMNIIEKMNQTLDLIQKHAIKTDLTSKNVVLNLFKAFKSLNAKEIIQKTNLDKEIVFSILAELQKEKLIRLTTRGRFTLNE